MANNWVDFKSVKDAVSMEMVLTHYRINWLRNEKGELVGRCPIHQGEGDRAFHVSLAKNAFNCFSCKALVARNEVLGGGHFLTLELSLQMLPFYL